MSRIVTSTGDHHAFANKYLETDPCGRASTAPPLAGPANQAPELGVFNDSMLNDIGICRLHITGNPWAASNFIRSNQTGRVRNRLKAPMGTVRAVLHKWRRRAHARRELRRLDTRFLRDIGLTCPQARGEWNKPFWRQ